MKKLNKKGFTLVELIVVIAIIGILAAVLVPSVTSYIGKAQKSAAQQNATNQYSSLVYALPECGGDINTFLEGVKLSGTVGTQALTNQTIKGYYVSSNGYTVLIIDGKTDVVLKGNGTKITGAKLTSAYTGKVENGVSTVSGEGLDVSAIYDEYAEGTKGVFIALPSVASKDEAPTTSCTVTFK